MYSPWPGEVKGLPEATQLVGTAGSWLLLGAPGSSEALLSPGVVVGHVVKFQRPHFGPRILTATALKSYNRGSFVPQTEAQLKEQQNLQEVVEGVSQRLLLFISWKRYYLSFSPSLLSPRESPRGFAGQNGVNSCSLCTPPTCTILLFLSGKGPPCG